MWHLHEVWSVPVDDRTQGQATLPGRGEIRHADTTVALRLPLTPVQQLTGAHDGFYEGQSKVKHILPNFLKCESIQYHGAPASRRLVTWL